MLSVIAMSIALTPRRIIPMSTPPSDGNKPAENSKIAATVPILDPSPCTYRDEGISGSKDSRPALDRLMKDARARKFDVVIVARFDRFARSVSHLLRALEEFSHLGVDFVSLSESIDTSTPMGKMIFTVLGAVAELESNLINERVHMGISRARKEGKSLGRPKRIFDRERALTMLQTMSVREAARHLGVSRGVIERALSIPSRSDS
jgi:DNA invertase Pin-like site-specific DNA recombinase